MTSPSEQEGARSFRCAVITVSNSLDEDTDRPGSYLRVRLQKAGHQIVMYRIIPEDISEIRHAIRSLAGQVDLVFLNGAEPAPPIDSSSPAIEQYLDSTIPGFRELYRILAYEEIGPLAMLSRVTAGVVDQTVYFSLPGTLEGVRVGMEKLVLPELRELVRLVAESETAT